MAYINERVPREEAREFKLPPYGIKESVWQWTIDKEKNAILFKGGVDRDNPQDEYFYFFYKGKVIYMILNGREYVNKNTRKWKLVTISIPPGLKKDEVLKELREAVKVYGGYGMTAAEIELYKRKFNDENANGFAIADF